MMLKVFYVIFTTITIIILSIESYHNNFEINRLRSEVAEFRKISYENYEKYSETKDSLSSLISKYEECSIGSARKTSIINEFEANYQDFESNIR